MKKDTKKLSIIATTIVIGLIATASVSLACCGNCMGHGTNTATTLSADQQQKLDTVKEKYSPQLDELQSSLNSKTGEYSKAMTNDNTTVGTLNRLEAEKAELEHQYYALLDQANKEAGLYASGNNGPWFGCNYRGCSHHQNHMAPHSKGSNMGQSRQYGMHGNHKACCW